MEEYVDVLDQQGKKTGQSVPKNEAHRQGLWHATAHVWIYDSCGNILVQQRALCKDTFAGLWDISVAGHADAGESIRGAAVREVREEIGLPLREEELEMVGIQSEEHFHADKNWTNREVFNIFFVKKDIPDLSSLHLQREEVEAVRWVSPKEFTRMFITEGKGVVPHDSYYAFIARELSKRIGVGLF